MKVIFITPEGYNLSGASVKIVEAERMATQKVDQLSLEGSYPIKIIARGTNPLELDIHYEEDWAVIESYITSLKKRWEKSKHEK